MFGGVARVINSGGVFCFSVETAGTPQDASQTGRSHDFTLQPSLRYAHSDRYIRTLAARHGFTVEHCLHAPIRDDRGKPVPGLYFWLARI